MCEVCGSAGRRMIMGGVGGKCKESFIVLVTSGVAILAAKTGERLSLFICHFDTMTLQR